jgi:hypothetical protein
MTFEQWTEEMKKGINLQRDVDSKVSSWRCDRFEGDTEEEEASKSKLKKN